LAGPALYGAAGGVGGTGVWSGTIGSVIVLPMSRGLELDVIQRKSERAHSGTLYDSCQRDRR
jgi:hypothetical protein